MNVIIYGATDLGLLICKRFFQRHSITLIDNQGAMPDKFASLDIHFISGSGADIETLELGNIKKGELFIACSELDEANIVACWTAKKIIDIETVCFVSTMALYQNLVSPQHNKYKTRYDIDMVIWPEKLLTQDIFRIISVPQAIDVEYFADGRAKLFEYRINADSTLKGTRVMDCQFPDNVLIVGITRDQQLFIPDGSTIIEVDDKVIFIGTGEALDKLAASVFKENNRTKTATLIGGGSVGFMLARQLEQSGVKVKIIEYDEQRCVFLADNLDKSLILHGDGTDLELLEQEEVGYADVTVCITNNDEKNLLCSLLVKQLGKEKRIITRASNTKTAQLFEKVGIDVVVSPRESAIKELHNRMETNDINVLALVEREQGQVLRLVLPENYPDTRIKDISFGARAIIGVVKRGRKLLIPNGDTLLKAGDRLKIFTMAKHAENINTLFSP